MKTTLNSVSLLNMPTGLKASNNAKAKEASLNNSQKLSADTLAFKGDDKKSKYENPINRKMEIGLAAWGALALSLASGLGLALLSHNLMGSISKQMPNKKMIAMGVGAVTTLITGALSLPGAMYNANVTGFAKEKEMNVFSREKSFQTNVMEKLDKQVKDPEADLDTSLNSYLKLNMGRKGNAQTLGVMNVN